MNAAKTIPADTDLVGDALNPAEVPFYQSKIEVKVAELSALKPLDYELVRESAAKALGVRISVLDTRTELEKCISSMREWCELLAVRADEHIGYDGFSRNSLRKNGRAEITAAVDNALAEGWEEFIRKI